MGRPSLPKKKNTTTKKWVDPLTYISDQVGPKNS